MTLAPAPQGGVVFRICGKDGATSSKIGRVLPDGTLVRHAAPRSSGGPIAVGPDGEVWTLGESGRRHLALHRIGPGGGVKTFSLGTAKEPSQLRAYGLVPDRPGSAWVAVGEPAPDYYGQPIDSTGGALVHIAADGTVTRFRVPKQVEPQALVRGPDGNLWFTGVRGRAFSEHGGSIGKAYVGRMTPTGRFALFGVAGEESSPGGIAAGPDGRLWFPVTIYGNRYPTPNESPAMLMTISTDGTFGPPVELHAGEPWGEPTFGPEGNAWFSTSAGLLRLTPAGQETVFPSEGGAVVTGAEGDIWVLGPKGLERFDPGQVPS